MHEIEAKYTLPDPPTLRAALRRAGFTLEHRVHETNRLFDDVQQTLRGRGEALRLRSKRTLPADGESTAPLGDAGHVLTFKGPAANGAIKIRREVETPVGDADATIHLLSELGYHESFCFEKRRETWLRDDVEVLVDEVPQIGWYAEIEAPSAALVGAVAKELEIPADRVVPQTYVALLSTTWKGPGIPTFRF